MKFTVTSDLHFEAEPVKGSRFIVDVAPANTETEAQALLHKTAARFPDASHHCWAWRLALPARERASDDGEPSGSAGRPILSQLAGRHLVDTAVIVTRYFGGTKLGVGGLVRAYGGSAGAALDTMTFAPWRELTETSFEHDYALTEPIERALRDADGTFVRRNFGESVAVTVQLPLTQLADFAARIADISVGAIVLSTGDSLPY